MGDLTKNISRSELECSCGCGLASMDWETIEAVQECCDHFAHQRGIDKVVLSINSAARCYAYNRSPAVGSNDNSQHPRCCAMDIRIATIEPYDVWEYLSDKYPDKYGLGYYPSFTHIDTRSTKARWQG